LPFCHFGLRAAKPRSAAYPKELNSLGDHLRERRLDLGLRQWEVADRLGADLASLVSWEGQRREPALRFLPAILSFLGYNPRSEGQSFGDRLYRARTAKGISIGKLARLIGVDEATILNWEHGRHRPTSRLLARLREELPRVEKVGQIEGSDDSILV
jgi:transcriptional regulator with XRE-family HTH domain